MESQNEPITEANAAEAMAELRKLMPTLEQLGLSTTEPLPSTLTPGLMAVGRMANIRRHIKSGWKMVEGFLTKGGHKKHPTYDVPSYQPGDIQFLEHRDSFAVRMGATRVGPNRFWYNGMLIDNYGMLREQDACPICDSTHGEYRFMVRQRPPGNNRWESTWTYCPKCCTPLEIADYKAQVANPSYPQEPRRGR